MASTTTGTCLQGSLSTCAFLTPLCLPKARLTEPTVVRPRPVMVNTIVFTTTYPGVLGSNTFIPPSKSSKVEKEDVNCFASSKLWQSQLVSSAPRAIDESEFIIPGCSAIVSSAEGRRNYTDLQETAQWIGGTEIPKLILKDLLQ